MLSEVKYLLILFLRGSMITNNILFLVVEIVVPRVFRFIKKEKKKEVAKVINFFSFSF